MLQAPAVWFDTDIIQMVSNGPLALYVDGERSMAWITDRFNGLPTTPNCTDLITTE